VLICPTPVATTKSASSASSVSPGTVRDDRSLTRVCGHRRHLQSLGEGPDLVELDEDRVRDARVDAAAQDAQIGLQDAMRESALTELTEGMYAQLPEIVPAPPLLPAAR
jgi:hypothetical protein